MRKPGYGRVSRLPFYFVSNSRHIPTSCRPTSGETVKHGGSRDRGLPVCIKDMQNQNAAFYDVIVTTGIIGSAYAVCRMIQQARPMPRISAPMQG